MINDHRINKKQLIAFLICSVLIFSLVISYWIIDDRKKNLENRNRNFSGIVERVEYDIKHFPTIIIGDSTYYIGSGYNTGDQIEVGDSLIKKRGSEVYRLIKCKTHKVVDFTK